MMLSSSAKPSRFIRVDAGTTGDRRLIVPNLYLDILTGRGLPLFSSLLASHKIHQPTSSFWIDVASLEPFRALMNISSTELVVKSTATKLRMESVNLRRPGVGHFWKLSSDPHPTWSEFVNINETTNPHILREFYLCHRQMKFASNTCLFENQIRLRQYKLRNGLRSNTWISKEYLEQVFLGRMTIRRLAPGILIPRSDGTNSKKDSWRLFNLDETSDPQTLKGFANMGFHMSFYRAVALTWEKQLPLFQTAQANGHRLPLWFTQADLPELSKHRIVVNKDAVPYCFRKPFGPAWSRTYNADQCSDPLLLQRLVSQRRHACLQHVNYTRKKLFSYEVAVQMSVHREKYRLRSNFWISQVRMENLGFRTIPGSSGFEVPRRNQKPIVFFNIDQVVHGDQLLIQRTSEIGSVSAEREEKNERDSDGIW